MDDRNPYAPSQASLKDSGSSIQAGSGVTAWRYRQILITLPGAALPDRCVKCNEPADVPTKARKVYWHHPALYVLLLINVIIYAIVGAIVRKRATVAPGLCLEHKKRRRLGLTLAGCGFGLGLALIFADLNADGRSLWFAVGIVLMLAAALVGIFMRRVVYAHKIEKHEIWLKGCGPQFLDSLPQLPQS
jgi:hypothetical protein